MTEVIKGKALRQDLALYDGITPTRQRKSSSGGYVQGLAIGDEVDVLQIHGRGLDRNQTVIQNCVNSLGSLVRSIKFSPGTWTIESNTTIPANLTAIIPAGVVFNISSGITLTFSGPVKTDSDNFKSGSGTLTYTDDRMLQSVSGTNTITASTLSTLTTLKNGQEFFIVPATTCTGSVTINVNSTGAVNTRKNQSGGPVALVANDFIAGNLYRITYYSSGPYYMVANVSSYAQGADVASATTINLDTATGDYVHITGTTTITGVTLKQGQERTVVFDGALTFTNGASLILPGGANITTVAGDTAILRGEASGVVRCIDYIRKNTAPLAAVSGYVRGSAMYLNTDGGVTTNFDVSTNVTENTFESVGPTGSGATNIWTAMDNIPTTATIIILGVKASSSPSVDGEPSTRVYARQTGSSASAANPTSILEIETLVDDFNTGSTASFVMAYVPLDSSRRFDTTWFADGETARAINMYVKGFLV